MRLLNTTGAEHWITKAIVTSPGHTSRRASREANHTLHDEWWSLACYDETVDVISTLKIFSMVIILCLFARYSMMSILNEIGDLPYF